MKCDETISMKIALLTELADLIPDRRSMGLPASSCGTVAAQVHVLMYRLNSDQVHDRYMANVGDSMFLAMVSASDWVYDLALPPKDQAPSVRWLSTLKYQKSSNDLD